MYIKQIYTNCLAEAAYYIESDGEAAVIDPLRDPDVYLDLVTERKSSLKYIFETHFHADFISGHLDLANLSKGLIVFGPTAQSHADYPITESIDGQLFQLGKIKIKVLHTPGHTMESSCFLIIDENEKEHAIFTGDTLLLGDVGRPDLAVKSNVTKEDLASLLYDSIYDKLLPLNDHVIVYPGHGEGSQCGKALSSEKTSTIGEQKMTNYALKMSSKKLFVEQVLNGLMAPPQYFPKVASINQNGYDSFDKVINRSYKALSVSKFNNLITKQIGVVLDSRSTASFSQGHIPLSINIGLSGQFAVWVGTVIENLNTPILLVCEAGTEKEAITRLARVGYENVIGYLDSGIDSWVMADKIIDHIITICPTIFLSSERRGTVIDVRTPHEYNEAHINGAINIPLADLNNKLTELNINEHYTIYCKSGYRSSLACSLMKKYGFQSIVNIKKGYEGIINSIDCGHCQLN